ncbi:hypothetical protein [Winogradskya humida]|uniref:Uncharacterized protein n=1 Tax=Winogradskya humida TaxID=113566 RepID=A0ABQ3ZIS2_9ACTN|nr:hypothetical protein [Actinoplanes humidus]GIE18490.1 hypothetical protein Ahu01nite_015920 [Actinoplanes humidus]
MIIAAVLVGAGVAGVLVNEGLDRAEKWVSIVVGVLPLTLAAAAWHATRTTQTPARATQTPARVTQAPARRATRAAGPGIAQTGKYRVDVHNSQGVAVGDHATQHNSFDDAP